MGMRMGKTLAGLAVAVIAVLGAPGAGANPYNDPYHPNYGNRYCPGGGWVNALNGKGWCQGIDYPDGTMWHQAAYGAWGTNLVTTRCVVHVPGALIYDPAPVGGCGGEWP